MTHETEVHMRIALDTLRDAAFAVQAACERLPGPRMLSADEWEVRTTLVENTCAIPEGTPLAPPTGSGWMLVRTHATESMVDGDVHTWATAIWARKRGANG